MQGSARPRSCRARRGRFRQHGQSPSPRRSRRARSTSWRTRSDRPGCRSGIRGRAGYRLVDPLRQRRGRPREYMYAFGSSQSGRFLRNFLYQGFNTDEQGRQVFDAVMAHIAGAARIDLNRRWATPTTLGGFSATSFPSRRREQRDPVTGVRKGAGQHARAEHQPKIFYTNTGVEYWGGGRSAALIHTSPMGAGCRAAGQRARLLPGRNAAWTGAFPRRRDNGQQRTTRPTTGGPCGRSSSPWTGGCVKGLLRRPIACPGCLTARSFSRRAWRSRQSPGCSRQPR